MATKQVFVCIVLLHLAWTDALRPMGRLTDRQREMLANNASIEEYWRNITLHLEKWAEGKTKPIIRHWNLNVRSDANVRANVSKGCLDVIEYMLRNPLKEEWIARMFDANGKIPSGLLSGTTTSLGDFDQCLELEGNHREQTFVGKYCLATLSLPRQQRFDRLVFAENETNRLRHAWLGEYFSKWNANDNYYSMAQSLCFPSICSANEIRHLLLAYYPTLERFEMNVTYCQSVEEPSAYDPRIWIAVRIFSSACALVVLATLAETFLGQDNCPRLLRVFSATTNLRTLFRISRPTDPIAQRFQFVHGLRAILALFILIAHSGGLVLVMSLVPVSPIARHPQDMIATSQSAITQPFYNGFLIVYIFFIISGMLLTYNLANKGRLRVSYLQFIALRWFRFAPTIIGLFCLTACLELFGNGPLFHHELVWPNLEQCYDYWYYNLLFINNFLDLDYACNLHNWYLAADMQIHLVSFILLVIYMRSSRATYWTCFAFIGLGVAAIFLVVCVLQVATVTKVQVIAFTQLPIPNGSVKYLFFSPWMQLIAYFSGAVLGLMLLEDRRLQLSTFQEKLLWALSIFFFVTIPVASYFDEISVDTVTGGGTIQDAATLVVVSFLWTFTIVWFIYQCFVDGNNPLARFLSAPVLQPFSRVSFSFYMVHLMTIWYNLLQTRTPINMVDIHEIFKNTNFSIIQSLMLGVLLYLTFEAPSVNLIKLLKDGAQTKSEKLKDKVEKLLDEDEKQNNKQINNNTREKLPLDENKNPQK